MTPKGVWVAQDALCSPRVCVWGGEAWANGSSQRHTTQGCRLGLGHGGGAHLHLGRAVGPLGSVTNRMSLLPARPQPQPSPPPPSPPPTPPPGPRALAGLAVRLSVPRGREPSRARGRSSGVGGGGRSRGGLRSWCAQDAWRGLREPSSVPRAGREPPPPPPLPLGPGSRPGALRSGAGAGAGAGGQLPRMLLRAPRREGGPSGAGGDSARSGTGTGPGPAAACPAARSGSHAGSRSGSALCRGVGREREERAASQGGRRDRGREGASERAQEPGGGGEGAAAKPGWGSFFQRTGRRSRSAPAAAQRPGGSESGSGVQTMSSPRPAPPVLPPCTMQRPSGSQAPASLKPSRPAVFPGSVHPFACDCLSGHMRMHVNACIHTC